LRKDPANLELQCELLALNAMLEAVRGDDRAQDFARRATRLSCLARELADAAERGQPPGSTVESRDRIDHRVGIACRRQQSISALAAEIGADSRASTCALQLKDEDSRVVVYSKERARRLQALVAQIECRQQMLQRDIDADRGALQSMAQAVKKRLANPAR